MPAELRVQALSPMDSSDLSILLRLTESDPDDQGRKRPVSAPLAQSTSTPVSSTSTTPRSADRHHRKSEAEALPGSVRWDARRTLPAGPCYGRSCEAPWGGWVDVSLQGSALHGAGRRVTQCVESLTGTLAQTCCSVFRGMCYNIQHHSNPSLLLNAFPAFVTGILLAA